MELTFYGCISLVNAPEIPSSVTNMTGTFRGCKKLTVAPKIPEGLTSMNDTFKECSQLLTGPIIPASVTTMSSAFYGCTNLSGILQINSSIISDMSSCFQNVKSLAVKVPASSTTYDTITSAYGSSTNITIETFEPEA